MAAGTRTRPSRARCFRVCDSRWPFLWATSDQPAARWHGVGEGPVAYLSSTAKGAWAEFLRHEGIHSRDELAGVERSLWSVDAPWPAEVSALPFEVTTGDDTTYPACQDEARRRRAEGAVGLRAPSAALISGRSEAYGVDRAGATLVDEVETVTVVVFTGPDGGGQLRGMPLADGRPEPTLLRDVRHLTA